MISLFRRKPILLCLPLILICTNSWADNSSGTNAEQITGTTGIIFGTPPVIYNDKNDPGAIDITKDNKHSAEEVLDVGDTVSVSWHVADSEGDNDTTDSTIIWNCHDQNNSDHVIQTGGKQYTIAAADTGCTIGVKVVPATSTGIPQENTALNIQDISTYSSDDNIPSGPVNPHQLSIKDYVVSPDTASSLTVEPSNLLHTAWRGGQLQLDVVDTGAGTPIIYSSSNDNVATVTNSGRVTFVSKGNVTLTANNGITSVHISFDPKLFFILPEINKTWDEAKSWCEQQSGYNQPRIEQLSDGKARTVPADSLWQEWGSANSKSANAWWSSSPGGEPNSYQYAYKHNGSISDNYATAPETVACVM